MPKIVDHDQYRKELLAKSFHLFAEKGYATVTMREIAKALEVSTGTLYHYFPSKELLFEQLMDELTQQDIRQFTEATQGATTQAEKIAIAFQFMEQNQDNYFKLTLVLADFYQQQSNQGTDSVLQRIFQRSLAQVEQEISNLFGIQDPDLTTFVISYIDGLIWQKIYGNRVDYTKQGELFLAMLTAYLNQLEPSSKRQPIALKEKR
ncbi:MAG: TetR/AcrR family transcriptional regulator [Aphanocapsa sp. GSE-SYN-MK-11-07L]|jgi:AcrR family transcriptional regulator|nr:TetR/AcrR family transcriptional regulator [Aphanocapsa sp. GSE-SYN-MK-11-07L]